jgi:hypothetical protein
MRDLWLAGTALTAAMLVSCSMTIFAESKMASETSASTPSVTISPFELMTARQRFSLPVDYCTHPF